MPVSDYSLEPELNVSISGINIAEGCAPSGLNDAIRQLMADVKAECQSLGSRATSKVLGLALLSDSVSGTGKADSGMAASEYAVKLAWDKATEGVEAAGAAQSTADSASSAAVAAQASASAAQDAASAAHSAALGASTAAAEAQAKAENALARDAMPVGAVIAFAGSADPAGYLLCNGAAVSRTTYAALFAVIGTTYGAGNGSTTFSLPNLTDRFIQGSGTAGRVKEAGLPNIAGSIDFDKGTSPFNGNGAPSSGAFYSSAKGENYAEPGITGGQYKLHLDASRSNAIYGKSTTVQPPALTMRYCIKY